MKLSNYTLTNKNLFQYLKRKNTNTMDVYINVYALGYKK